MRGILIVLLLICTTPALADYSSVVLADNPVGYWSLNDLPGSNTAADSSTSKLDGTAHNVTFGANPRPSSSNTTASFNGSTSYVDIPDNPTLHVNAFTIEAWVFGGTLLPKATYGLESLLNIYGQQRTLNGTGINFGLGPSGLFNNSSVSDPSDLRLYLGINDFTSNIAVASTAKVNAGEWTYIAATFNGSNSLQVYINGMKSQTLQSNIPINLNSIYNGNNPTIGREFDGSDPLYGSRSYNGLLGDVALYNHVLTDTQILSHASLSPDLGLEPPTPIPAAFLLFGSGLVAIGIMRGRIMRITVNRH